MVRKEPALGRAGRIVRDKQVTLAVQLEYFLDEFVTFYKE
jgi:hypothetical protein